MFKMTELEQIYQILFENDLTPEKVTDAFWDKNLRAFDRSVLREDPVQKLSPNDGAYPEALFIDADAHIAVVRRPRFRPHNYMHSHDYIELTYTYAGQCVFISPRQEPVVLQAGDIHLLATDTKHQFYTDSVDSIVFHIAVRKSTFDEAFFLLLDADDVLSHFFSRILYGDTPITHLRYRTGNDAKIHKLLLDMFQETASPDRMTNRMLNVCFEWLCIYLMRNFQCEAPVAIGPDKGRDIMQMITYLKENLQEVSLHQMAAHFGYNKAYFCRMIKKYTGENFSKLLNDLRMQKACELLRCKDINVPDLAVRLGYQDTSSFYRAFKRTYGITPAEYVQQK